VRRAIALGFAVVTLVVAAANPVWAHSGVNANASLHSELDSAPAGVGVIVAADGSGITVTTTADLVVLGYDGEPFLRFAGGQVAENTNSMTTYQAGNGLLAAIPPSAGHGPVRWHAVATSSTYNWPDGRVTWSGSTLPAAVLSAPKQGHDVAAWSIPVEIGGVRSAITGRVVWVPPPDSVGLTMVGVFGFIAVALLLAVVAAFPDVRHRALALVRRPS
jgi:hypothetical protein